MVSYIQSNFMGFGSGVVIPETGIALHNRGVAFSLEPSHPNEFAGGKRPYHTIIPSFLTREGKPIGPFGVMGGHMQAQGYLQVIIGTIGYGFGLQAALDAPPWQVTHGLKVKLERGISADVRDHLSGRGHDVSVPEGTGGFGHEMTRLDTPLSLKEMRLAEGGGFGRGQIIWQLDAVVYVAGSGMRADGAAVGW